jgi:hypothetical protein
MEGTRLRGAASEDTLRGVILARRRTAGSGIGGGIVRGRRKKCREMIDE